MGVEIVSVISWEIYRQFHNKFIMRFINRTIPIKHSIGIIGFTEHSVFSALSLGKISAS